MAVKDALLALLADGPSHGYNLKSRFDEATGSAWPLNVGQVYTTLQRLESSRDEVSMKVMIALATGVAPALDIVQTQRISAMETLQSLTAMKPQGPKRGLAWQLHLDRSILLAESEVRWLDLVEKRLEANDAGNPNTGGNTNGTGNRQNKSGKSTRSQR